MKEFLKNYIEEKHSFDKTTMIGIFSLIIVISGIFGFIYEFIFYYFNDGMTFHWQGGNFLPWINIYAIGAMFIYLFAYKYRKSPLKVFLIGLISCGLLEYIAGLLIYIIGDGLRYWDYNTEILNFGNIQGFICFRSVFFFGISSLLLIYVIVPLCFGLSKKINKRVFLIISITLCSIILLDEFYNLIITRIWNVPSATSIYKNLGIILSNYNP